MIEKLARAMAAADSGPEGSKLFDFHWAEFGEGYKSSARACLEALREPTDPMCVAGWRKAEERGVTLGNGEIAMIWQAMIDVALERKAA